VGLLNVIGLCIALALLFVYVELLLASQSPYWTGESLEDWKETAQAFGIYISALTAAALIPFCVIAPFLMASSLRHGLSVVLPFLAAIALWIYLAPDAESIPTLLRFGFPGGLIVLMISIGTLGATRIVQPTIAATLVLIVVGGGIATLNVSANELLLDPDRVPRGITTSLLWCAVSSAGAFIVCIATSKAWPRWMVRMVSTLVLCSLYPGFLFIQPHVQRLVGHNENQNVLLITVDTLRADYCSAYGGSVPTPNLEALAADGVLFNRHYSLAPWTVPSINSLMTSKYPPGLTPNAPGEQRADEVRSYQQLAGYWLDRDGVTFTKRLANHGYDTAAVFANPMIQFQEWLTQGFQGHKPIDPLTDREPILFKQTPMLRKAIGKYRPEFLQDRSIDSSATVTRFGLAYLRRHRAEPFFLWLHFMDPHSPYDPPQRFRSIETPWAIFPPTDFDGEVQLSEADKRAAQSLYEAEVQHVDDCVGRLLYRLRELGLEDDTLVCFTSTHGEELWDHQKWGHGHDLYDEQIRVPLIIAGRQVTPDAINAPVSSIDVLPTIADILGHDKNPEWHGNSLAPAFSGENAETPQGPVFAQATHYFRYSPEPAQMVVDRNLKLIVGLETGVRRLYDLSEDPGEKTNLADSMPDAVARLHGMLEVWSAAFPSNIDEVAGWSGGAVANPAGQDLDEILESLGYIQ
jgi:arylsulfatase A-like enzyme